MKKAASLLCLAVLFLMLGGCQMIRIEEENKTPLAYTVIEDSQIPEEMQELIREKKETEFQIAYQKGTELFLAKGYGRQMSGGYSIQVKELSASSNAVFFETKLMYNSFGQNETRFFRNFCWLCIQYSSFLEVRVRTI